MPDDDILPIDTNPQLEPQPAPSDPAPEGAPEPQLSGEDQSAEKKPTGAERRIGQLTREKNEERRAKEAERRRADELEARIQAIEAGQKPTESAKEAPPRLEDYGENVAQYVTDLAKFDARQAARDEWQRLRDEEKRQSEQQSAAERQRSAVRNYESKLSEASTKYEDFHDALDACPTDFSRNGSAMLIMQSEVAGDLAYHLAKNPEVAERIASLHPLEAAREIGKLELKVAAAHPAKPPVSKFPAPTPSVGGTRSNPTPTYSDDMDMESYVRWSNPR